MFDDQVKIRKQKDDEMLREMYASFAGVVLGATVQQRLSSNETLSKNAVDAVLHYYHVKNLSAPENITDPMERLNYLCRDNGIMYRNVSLGHGWYKDAIGAHLGILKSDGSVVALIPGKLGGYNFFDKERREWRHLNSKTEGLFETNALCFYVSLPMKQLRIPDLIAFVKNCFSISDVIVAVAMTFFAALIGMIGPRMTNLLFGDVIEVGEKSALLAIFIFMLFTTVGRILIELSKTFVMSRISTKLDISANAAAIQRLLQMPASFFRNYSAGELSSYIGLVSGVCNDLFSIVFSTGLTTIFSIVYVFQIAEYAPTLVVPAVIVIAVTTAYTMLTALVSVKYNEKFLEKSAKMSGLTYSLIDSVRKIRLAGAEKRAFAKWGESYGEYAGYAYNRPIILKYNSVFSLAISLIGTIVMYFVAGSNNISVANYAAFTSAYGMVSAAFMSFAGIATTIAGIRPSLNRVKPLMDTVPETSIEGRVVTKLDGEVEMRGITFRYDENSQNVLDNLSLHIKPGEYVAIVGRTGCGKSTLIRILLGLEKAQKGAVYYDSVNLDNLDHMSLRSKIGTVTQNGMLFMARIRDNISITCPTMSLDEIWEAAETAGIAEDIRQMPMEMNTYVSEGSGISGGQKQRIMIARAIAPKPSILIFDEATSALDNITQRQVSEALDRMNCTRIVVAHRLSTIKLCDRIIVLDNGTIAEEGTFDELIEKNGIFAELVKRQR